MKKSVQTQKYDLTNIFNMMQNNFISEQIQVILDAFLRYLMKMLLQRKRVKIDDFVYFTTLRNQVDFDEMVFIMVLQDSFLFEQGLKYDQKLQNLQQGNFINVDCYEIQNLIETSQYDQDIIHDVLHDFFYVVRKIISSGRNLVLNLEFFGNFQLSNNTVNFKPFYSKTSFMTKYEQNTQLKSVIDQIQKTNTNIQNKLNSDKKRDKNLLKSEISIEQIQDFQQKLQSRQISPSKKILAQNLLQNSLENIRQNKIRSFTGAITNMKGENYSIDHFISKIDMSNRSKLSLYDLSLFKENVKENNKRQNYHHHASRSLDFGIVDKIEDSFISQDTIIDLLNTDQSQQKIRFLKPINDIDIIQKRIIKNKINSIIDQTLRSSWEPSQTQIDQTFIQKIPKRIIKKSNDENQIQIMDLDITRGSICKSKTWLINHPSSNSPANRIGSNLNLNTKYLYMDYIQKCVMSIDLNQIQDKIINNYPPYDLIKQKEIYQQLITSSKILPDILVEPYNQIWLNKIYQLLQKDHHNFIKYKYLIDYDDLIKDVIQIYIQSIKQSILDYLFKDNLEQQRLQFDYQCYDQNYIIQNVASPKYQIDCGPNWAYRMQLNKYHISRDLFRYKEAIINRLIISLIQIDKIFIVLGNNFENMCINHVKTLFFGSDNMNHLTLEEFKDQSDLFLQLKVNQINQYYCHTIRGIFLKFFSHYKDFKTQEFQMKFNDTVMSQFTTLIYRLMEQSASQIVQFCKNCLFQSYSFFKFQINLVRSKEYWIRPDHSKKDFQIMICQVIRDIFTLDQNIMIPRCFMFPKSFKPQYYQLNRDDLIHSYQQKIIEMFFQNLDDCETVPKQYQKFEFLFKEEAILDVAKLDPIKKEVSYYRNEIKKVKFFNQSLYLQLDIFRKLNF